MMSESKQRSKNIFVLYLDDEHLQDLEAIPNREDVVFHGLLPAGERTRSEDFDVDAALDKAERQLRDFDEPIDAIIGYWDFPVTAMAAILCEKFGLPSPSLEAVLKCAHKYWSRVEQKKIVPEFTPNFCAVNPFSNDPFSEITLRFPFWIKPVCSYSSMLGFKINNRREFDRAMDISRKSIRRIGAPFNKILSRIDASELNGIDGTYMVAEEFMPGIEIAPEGYIKNGEVHIHGVVDMIRAANHKSFQAYRYPSTRARRIQERCNNATAKLLTGIGYNNGCFNVEFFWNQDNDQIRIIEVNPRVSQSHSKLMAHVDGMSNYEVAIHVGAGDEPHFEHGGGPFNIAAKFMYRRFDVEDARCVRAPNERDLARLHEQQPETSVTIAVHEGDRLEDVADRDSYSWVLAELVIAGHNVSEINQKFDEAKDFLPFEFSYSAQTRAQPPEDMRT
ncbi:acetyl-CoA carboxylase biotin carboxylase subunit family protein [Marinimicrobium sp. ABcell2]|uniref:ATP-grasp domain-containing protein n=1 Tax=Marinimicrobium sp. ABcell2 TaxID=3069751 RepID=UPI0027AE7E06|nr:ATP-grasp domain-containing protein [Marinimicrobium sp. ABcell2]MDQ2075305.1 ATP-grasp domain-containing protein [Marinimicrobium sp. ABcell2]